MTTKPLTYADAGVSIDAKMLPGTHNGVVPGAVAESIRFFNQIAA